jgi:hypothetical protein
MTTPKPKQMVALLGPNRVDGARPTEIKGINPKDAYGDLKVDFNTLPTTALVFMALAMKTGDLKYGFQNYRVAPVQARTYLGAARRHLLALVDGEDLDPATAIHHGGFIMATIGIYLDAMVNGKLIDNRVVPGRTGELITLFNDVSGDNYTVDNMRRAMLVAMRCVSTEDPPVPCDKQAEAPNAESTTEGIRRSRDGNHRRNAGRAKRNRRKRVD